MYTYTISSSTLFLLLLEHFIEVIYSINYISYCSWFETKQHIYPCCFFCRFNKEKLHSLLTERCYPVSSSSKHCWSSSPELCHFKVNVLWRNVQDSERNVQRLTVCIKLDLKMSPLMLYISVQSNI